MNVLYRQLLRLVNYSKDNMKQLNADSLRLVLEADGTLWLHIGSMLSLNLTALAETKGPVWLFQFKQWAKGLKER